MGSSRSLGLAQRLVLFNGVFIAAMVALAVFVAVKMKVVTEHAEYTRIHRAPQELRVSELELNVTQASLLLRHAILARTPQEQERALTQVQAKARFVATRLQDFGAAMTTDEGRQAYAPMPALMQAFQAAAAENVKMIQSGQKAEAFAFLADQLVPVRNRLLEPLAAEKKRQAERLDVELANVAEEAAMVRWAVLAVVVVVAVGLAGFAAYIVRVMRQLGGEPGELKQLANAVAAGNLATRIELRAGDQDSVLCALKGMADQLAGTVRAVRLNAERVAEATAEIASGNADLSSRTDRQSGTLAQAAAAMEQLSGTVRRNAGNASQANQLAMGSSSIAGRGGEMVNEVVRTMQAINEGSQRIAEITGTIDGIAFQTNILALNAAVEAARAGEHGRGFAVVAGEVRSLAQRCAEAAREIKDLIGTSVQRVEAGTELVDRAGSTMQEIVDSIRRVSDIVAEISLASTEQSAGVSQAGEAVTQLDQATQQNVALVQQTADAAAGLQRQADQLVQAVAVFRLA